MPCVFQAGLLVVARFYRTLTTTDGGTIKEKLVEQTDTSYTYDIIDSPLPVENYRVTISVSAEGDGTRVDWNSSFTQGPVG